jgi:hypothetical protein
LKATYIHSAIAIARAIISAKMLEPIKEKMALLDTEYIDLLDLGIEDDPKYLEHKSGSSSSKTALTRLKVEIAAASLVMLLGTGFLAFQILNFEPARAKNDNVTAQFKARLILEMHLLQLQQLHSESSCP